MGVEFWGWLFIIALLGTSFALVVRMFLRDYGIWESLLYSFACFGLIAILAVFKAVTKNW